MFRRAGLGFVLCVLMLAYILGGGSPQARAVDGEGKDIKTATWDGSGAVQFLLAFKMDDDAVGTLGTLGTIKSYAAVSDFETDHCHDTTVGYKHYHLWDSSSAKGAEQEFSAASKAAANRFWDAAFGVSAKTGNGKLDGDTVTRDSDATLKQDCAAYAFTKAECKGGWNYALRSDSHLFARNAITDSVADKTAVAEKNILFYPNGTSLLGWHYTWVETVAANKPKKMRWKYMLSGVYTLDRTQNFWDTPMYWKTPGGKFEKAADFTLLRGGAGEADWVEVRKKK